MDGRRGAIGEVLGAVRLGLLPAPYLTGNVATDPLIEHSLDVGRLLIRALSARMSGVRVARIGTRLFRARSCASETGLPTRGWLWSVGGLW